jgi:hypothetical protein
MASENVTLKRGIFKRPKRIGRPAGPPATMILEATDS